MRWLTGKRKRTCSILLLASVLVLWFVFRDDGRLKILTKKASHLILRGRTVSSQFKDEEKQDVSVTSFPVAKLTEACEQLSNNFTKGNNLYGPSFRSHLYYNKVYKFLFCLIEKVGCSFFKRFLYFFQNRDGSGLKNPFDLSLRQAHIVPLDNFKYLSNSEISTVLHSYKKFIFVRDPYARLFSGYVDKIFSRCNTWRKYNQFILERIGQNFAHRECADDVTFAEFVEFFVQTMSRGKSLNGHFVPMHQHCKPCQTNYDFVGKLENFEHDIKNMMSETGLSNYTYLLRKSKEATVNDEIEDVVNILFKKQKSSQKYEKCFDTYKLALRQWRKLQIKGIISLHIRFPFEWNRWKTVKKKRFLKKLLEIHKLSKANDESLQDNRRKAMTEAYQSLSAKTLGQLKRILEPDCRLFGYSVSPPFLNEKSKVVKPQFFDFNYL